MLTNLLFALEVTAPTFLVICIGIYLKRIGIINNEFADIGSALVFKVTLPCMLFVKLVQVSFETIPITLVAYAVTATTVVFLILEFIIAPRIIKEDRGAFVQGSFRSNMGIVGIAFCLNAYGESIIATVSIYLAFVTVLYNVLSLITLTRHGVKDTDKLSFASTLNRIVRNPLIVAIVIAVVLSLLHVKIPKFLLDTMGYLGAMSMPLALLCGGAAIRWRDFRVSANLYWATFAKLLAVPAFITIGGILIGLRGEMLGVLYLMCAAPTAGASYPMIRAVGGNHYLTAAIIASTSLASVVAITLGLFLLKALEFI